MELTPAELLERINSDEGTPRMIELSSFYTLMKAQEVPRQHVAFVCPMCKVVQSMASIAVACETHQVDVAFDNVELSIGFSCLGRFIDAPSPRKDPDGEPCNWTLGGLLQTHRLVVDLEDGKLRPVFVPATPEDAQALAQQLEAFDWDVWCARKKAAAS